MSPRWARYAHDGGHVAVVVAGDQERGDQLVEQPRVIVRRRSSAADRNQQPSLDGTARSFDVRREQPGVPAGARAVRRSRSHRFDARWWRNRRRFAADLSRTDKSPLSVTRTGRAAPAMASRFRATRRPGRRTNLDAAEGMKDTTMSFGEFDDEERRLRRGRRPTPPMGFRLPRRFRSHSGFSIRAPIFQPTMQFGEVHDKKNRSRTASFRRHRPGGSSAVTRGRRSRTLSPEWAYLM